jgi:cytochrome c-type biogenesis protein CcmH/NrfF
MRFLRAALLAVTILSALLGVAVAAAQTGGEELPPGVTADDVYRVSRKMYCDVCAGIPISDCPSPTCAAWRQEVANLLGEGYTDDEILQYFAERYGEKVSGVPLNKKDRIFTLGLPLTVALLVGMVIIWQVVRLSRGGETLAVQAAHAAGLRSEYERPVPDNVDPDYLERFLSLVEGKR